VKIEEGGGNWYHQRCDDGELCEGDVHVHIIVVPPFHEQFLRGVAKALEPENKQTNIRLFASKNVNTITKYVRGVTS
jgi:hypothetical protein